MNDHAPTQTTAGYVWHTEDRARAWQAIVRLAQKHELNLDICGQWMMASTDKGRREYRLVRRRYLAKHPRTLRESAAYEGIAIADAEMIETRGLLRLLARLALYDLNVSDGWSGVPLP